MLRPLHPDGPTARALVGGGLVTAATCVLLLILTRAGLDEERWVPLAIAALLGVAALRIRRPAVEALRTELPVLGLLFFVLVGLSSAVTGVFTAESAAMLALPIVAFSVAALTRSERGLSTGVTVLVGLLAVLTAASLVKLWTGWGGESGAVLVGGELVRRISVRPFGHPGSFGPVLAMLLCIAFAVATRCRQPAVRVVAGAILLLGLLALLVTYARAAWIGFGVAALVIAPGWRWRTGLAGCLLLFGALFGLRGIERLYSEDYTENVRLSFWEQALLVIQDHPLFGIGFGQFGDAVRDVRFPLDDQPAHPHHLILNVAVGAGVVAAVVATLFLVLFIIRVARQAQAATGARGVALWATLGGVTAAAVAGLFDNAVAQPYSVLVAAVTIGLGCGAMAGDSGSAPTAESCDEAPTKAPHQPKTTSRRSGELEGRASGQ